jgi:hypothetical protein
MQLLYLDIPAEEEGVQPTNQELPEIDAFIEAQLKTGVLLASPEHLRQPED